MFFYKKKIIRKKEKIVKKKLYYCNQKLSRIIQYKFYPLKKHIMAFKGALVIDTEKCKGCGVCITGCPNHCIALAKQVNKKGYNYLEMIDEDACIGCANCAVICPDGVITVYKVRV